MGLFYLNKFFSKVRTSDHHQVAACKNNGVKGAIHFDPVVVTLVKYFSDHGSVHITFRRGDSEGIRDRVKGYVSLFVGGVPELVRIDQRNFPRFFVEVVE